MGKIFIYEGMPLTEEDLKNLRELEKMGDDDIDYSDIPPLTDEDWKRMKRVYPHSETIKKAAN